MIEISIEDGIYPSLKKRFRRVIAVHKSILLKCSKCNLLMNEGMEDERTGKRYCNICFNKIIEGYKHNPSKTLAEVL